MNTNYDLTTKLLNEVKNTINKQKLIKSGDRVLVALSGGADSVFMLDALCRLRKELNIKIAAAHLNHMIRGAEADRDEAYAAELCTRLKVPFYAERIDVPQYANAEGISEELAGRNLRYDFFDRICKANGYNKIATAHNKNDKAETVLMRIIRGTGIDGLCGIKYTRGDMVIRPILDIERRDIEKYCNENALVYCTDSTNLENDYTRNKVRNELIPFIEKNFNPSVLNSLCTLADNSTEDVDFINGYAERLYKRINSPMPKRKPIVLDIKSLQMIGDSIQGRILRMAAIDVMGDNYALERVHIEILRDLMEKETGASVNLPSGLIVSVKYGWLEFVKAELVSDTKDFSYPIEIGNKLSENEVELSFEVVSPSYKRKKNQMLIDYDMLEGKKLVVRNRRIGDRMVFFKDGRRRKLKDYWIDKKLAREERAKIALLCADNEVIAIIGDRVAESYKIKDTTKKGLVVTYGADNENR